MVFLAERPTPTTRQVSSGGPPPQVLRDPGQPPKKFFRKLLKGLRYVPRVIVTDKLASYQVAHRELVPSVAHRRSRYLNSTGPRTRISRPGNASGR